MTTYLLFAYKIKRRGIGCVLFESKIVTECHKPSINKLVPKTVNGEDMHGMVRIVL